MWVREIRKVTDTGHPTAILPTDYRGETARLAGAMFSRWSQENFFRYLRQHYSLDSLVDYRTEVIPKTTPVVNPAYRTLDGQVRKKLRTLSRKRPEFGALNLEGGIEPLKVVEAFERRKAELQESIAALQEEGAALKAERKATQRHIPFPDLPEEERFKRLSTQSKHFVDTIKMIAYRAETAMAQILREKMARYDDGRSLLRAVYRSEIDPLPNAQEKILTVRFHPLANQSYDDAPSAIYAPNSTVPSCSFQAPIYASSTNWSHRIIGEIRRSEGRACRGVN